MSKDPALLFYTSDFLSGTAFMNMEQRGQYITLLCEQHQNGHIPEEHMLIICKTYDSIVLKKFIKDEDGYYFNDRMEKEIVRRKTYSESRRKNRMSDPEKTYDATHDNTYVDDVSTHMETETETVIKNRKMKPFVIPTIEEVKKYFDDNGYKPEVGESKWYYYNDADWFDSHGNPVLNWKQKMRQVWFKPENLKKVRMLA